MNHLHRGLNILWFFMYEMISHCLHEKQRISVEKRSYKSKETVEDSIFVSHLICPRAYCTDTIKIYETWRCHCRTFQAYVHDRISQMYTAQNIGFKGQLVKYCKFENVASRGGRDNVKLVYAPAKREKDLALDCNLLGTYVT